MEEENKKLDERKVSEKIEDTLDDISDAICGPGDDFLNDIPAVHKLDSGRRIINKTQTRKNINKRIMSNKTYLKILIGFLIVGGIIALITWGINAMLMA